MIPPHAATVELQGLIDRLRQGDAGARRELLERACQRLRLLAAKMLHGSFPAVRANHEVDSIVNETWLRLLPALEKAEPPTVADFFRLAAHKIRQVLLDMADRQRRGQPAVGLDSASQLPERSDHTYNPAQLALWTELHHKVAELPDEQRAVFEMHHYLGLPQAEIAVILALHPREVSRRWMAARDRLADYL
jgi:RNA polymerase sigma factor (sigma-70 family)